MEVEGWADFSFDGDIAYRGNTSPWSERVCGFDKRTGEQVSEVAAETWGWPNQEVCIADGVIYSPDLRAHHSAFAREILRLVHSRLRTSYDFRLFATDARSGRVLWHSQSVWGELSVPVAAEGFLYVLGIPEDEGAPSRLLAFSAERRD